MGARRWTGSRWLCLFLLASALGWTRARPPHPAEANEEAEPPGCGDFISERKCARSKWVQLGYDIEDHGVHLPVDLGFARLPFSVLSQGLAAALFLVLWFRDPLLYPRPTGESRDRIRRRLRTAGTLFLILIAG